MTKNTTPLFVITHRTPVVLADDDPRQISPWPEVFNQSHLVEVEPEPYFKGQGEAKIADRFRLYDDDGNLYFEGVFHCSGANENYTGFEPLWWFGEQYGCTEIRFWEADPDTMTYAWRQL